MRRWFSNRISRVFRWAESASLHYFLVKGVCCGDEFSQTVASRYDLERFGAQEAEDHRLADVLVITGAISRRLADELKTVFQEMPEPKWVIALGTCACSGGVFSPKFGGEALEGASETLPVDVFVPGCPPRPEAIIDGWIQLQKKIRRGRALAHDERVMS